MPRLTQTEQEEFLNTPGVLMRIACIKPDQRPMIVPIWFIYHDGAICFTPRAQSEWFHCIKLNPNVALSIDEQSLPYRKIIIEGAACLVHDLGEDDKWRDLYRQIARRYISDRETDNPLAPLSWAERLKRVFQIDKVN